MKMRATCRTSGLAVIRSISAGPPIARASALRGEDQERAGQGQGADEDIAVDRHHPCELGAIEQHGARDAKSVAVEHPFREREAEYEAAGLRDDRGIGRTRDALLQ